MNFSTDSVIRLTQQMLIVLVAYLSWTTVSADELTEQSAVFTALKKKNSFKILALDRGIDSLEFHSLLQDRLPVLTASIEPAVSTGAPKKDIVTRFDTTTSIAYAEIYRMYPVSSVESQIGVKQKLPGGGEITGAMKGNVTNVNHSRSLGHQSTYSLSYSQPLIKDAFRFGELNHAITVAAIYSDQLSLERKISLLNELSEVRSLYWDAYEKKSLLTIYRNELRRAEDLFQIEKTRMRIGEGTVLDSINADLNMLTAQQNVLDANIALEISISRLATDLTLTPDTLWVNDSCNVHVDDLADDSTLLMLFEQFDPKLQVFQKITQRLCLEHDKIRHNIYPDLRLNASVYRDQRGDNFFSDNGGYTSNAVIGLLFSYSIPVKKNLDLQAKSRYEFMKNEVNEKQYRIDAKNQIRNLRMSWKQELSRLTLMKQIVAVANQRLDIAQKEYELGTIDRIELSDASDKVIKSETDYLKSQIEMKRLEVIVDELTGTLFQKFNILID
ncbi:MAG TPA: TolC family protein [Chitinispirillaceae bacterium]|nr:TolC family protein [Chitinispirillaceae bacterium]